MYQVLGGRGMFKPTHASLFIYLKALLQVYIPKKTTTHCRSVFQRVVMTVESSPFAFWGRTPAHKAKSKRLPAVILRSFTLGSPRLSDN